MEILTHIILGRPPPIFLFARPAMDERGAVTDNENKRACWGRDGNLSRLRERSQRARCLINVLESYYACARDRAD